MENRPEIKIQPTRFDKTVEVISILLLIAFWVLTVFSYYSLPETIPIHYNGLGEADGFGPKTSIFMLPAIATFIFVILSLISKHPELFNHPVSITPENAERQYANATTMMRVLKLAIVIIFMAIDYQTIQIATEKSPEMGVWFLPVVLGILFLPIGYFIYRSFRLKGK